MNSGDQRMQRAAGLLCGAVWSHTTPPVSRPEAWTAPRANPHTPRGSVHSDVWGFISHNKGSV